MVNRRRGKLEEKRLALVMTRRITFYGPRDSGDSSDAGVGSISCFGDGRITGSLCRPMNKAESSQHVEAPTCSRLATLGIAGCRLASHY
jgi:hypothetical protein